MPDIKEYADNIYKVHTAVRIAIVPPWKIEDVEGHPAINLGSLAVTAIFFMVLRLFTPSGGFGLSEMGVLISLVFIFFLASGLVINFFDPTTDAAKLTNRWSTFMIVTFFYSILLLIAFSIAGPLTIGRSLWDVVGNFMGDFVSYLIVSIAVTGVAIALLYWRTARWFRPVLNQVPHFLVTAIALCAAVNIGILLLAAFLI